MKLMEKVPWPLRTLLALVIMMGYCLFAVVVSAFLLLAFPLWSAWQTHPRRNWLRLKSQAAHYAWAVIMWNLEVFAGLQLHWYGDELPKHETAVIISNHRSFNDWMVIFTLGMRLGRMGMTKFFVKESVKWLPGLGLGMWMMEMPFLKRDWTRDKSTIDATFAHMKSMQLPFWLVIFLEGTRFTASKHAQSEAWAKKNDLPALTHLLQARLKGFISTVSSLRDGTATHVYDVTIAYDDMKPPPFLQCVAGAGNCGVHVHVRRIAMEDIPVDTEEMQVWCRERWLEKDQLLDGFVRDGTFPQPQDLPMTLTPLNLSAL